MADAPKKPLAHALFAWALFLAAETATQAVFKIAGETLHLDGGLFAIALSAASNPWVVAGFFLYFLDFVLWMTILKDDDVGRAFPISSVMYVTTLLAAALLFHEALTPLRLLGAGVIMGGVALLSGDEAKGGRA